MATRFVVDDVLPPPPPVVASSPGEALMARLEAARKREEQLRAERETLEVQLANYEAAKASTAAAPPPPPDGSPMDLGTPQIPAPPVARFDTPPSPPRPGTGVKTPRTLGRWTAAVRDSSSGFQSIRKAPVASAYHVGRTLGTGAFACVYAGRLRGAADSDGDECAIKIVPLETLCDKGMAALELEVRTMRRVAGHANIVSLRECYLHGNSFALVMELCRGGELFDRIVAKAYYGEDEARVAFAQMVEAVGHCHAREVVHRDLKPENLLYAAEEGARGGEVLKLADFGLARTLESDHHLSGFGGTPGYVAPEILLNASSYGKECDLWSLGVVLYIMLCGYPPFFDEHGRHSHVFRKIKQGRWAFHDPYWTSVSPEAKDLVLRLLTRDPRKRLPAGEVFDHAWLASSPPAKIHLPHFATNLRKYKLRRKFKAAVLAIAAQRRLAAFAHHR